MDIEELNKSQIILLTLMVSFITSIATGIVTVSLMEQAPEGITRTITHVVERTVETVKPGGTQVATVIKEVPVIVTEEEMVLKAINVASPAVVALQTEAGNRGKIPSVLLGTAFLVRSDGLFVTSGGLVQMGKTYEAVTEAGVKYRVAVSIVSPGGEIAVLKVVPSAEKTFTPVSFPNPVIFSEGSITIGQSVIGIGSSAGGNHNVAMGIVSNIISLPPSTATIVATNASSAENIGGPLVDIHGRATGLNLTAGRALGKSEVQTTIDLVK